MKRPRICWTETTQYTLKEYHNIPHQDYTPQKFSRLDKNCTAQKTLMKTTMCKNNLGNTSSYMISMEEDSEHCARISLMKNAQHKNIPDEDSTVQEYPG